MYKIHHIYLYF